MHHRNTSPLARHIPASLAFLSFGVVMELAESPNSSAPCKPLESPVSVSVHERSLCTGSHLLPGWEEAAGLATELWPLRITVSKASTWKGHTPTGAAQEQCVMLCPQVGSWRLEARRMGMWWEPGGRSLPRERALPHCGKRNQKGSEHRPKQDRRNAKIWCRNWAALGPQWFLKTKQVQSGWNLRDSGQSLFRGNSGIVLAGPEGSRVKPSTCSTIPSHKHQQDLLQLPTCSLYHWMPTAGFSPRDRPYSHISLWAGRSWNNRQIPTQKMPELPSGEAHVCCCQRAAPSARAVCGHIISVVLAFTKPWRAAWTKPSGLSEVSNK